jgi:hypothetical protein
MDAQRLIHGERIYQDFFQFTPPGTDLVYLGVFKLFGARIWVTNLVVLVLGIILCLLCYHISTSVMERSHAALTASLFVVFCYGRLQTATHHWFSVLAVLSAVAVLMNTRTPARIFIAGALLGVATFFTQTRGPIAAFAIAAYLAWVGFRSNDGWLDHLRNQFVLFAALLLTWTVFSGYYLATAGLRRIWFFQVTYVRQYKLTELWDSVPYVQRLFANLKTPDGILFPLGFFLLPFVYALSFWSYWRESRTTSLVEWDRVVLVAVVGLALYVEIAHSPNGLRLYCIALPGIVLSIWMVGRAGGHRRYALGVLWIGTILGALYHIGSMHRHLSVIERLPGGKVATIPAVGEKLAWIAAHTKPEQFFFQAGWPGIYLPLELRNPTSLEDLETPGETRLGYVDMSIRQLECRRVRYVLWSPRLELPMYSLGAFRDYLGNHYQRIWTFSDKDEIWERHPRTDGARTRTFGSENAPDVGDLLDTCART